MGVNAVAALFWVSTADATACVAVTAPFTARLFGFKRHIAHGMWSAAHCVALLSDRIQGEPGVLDVQFRQPLFLPGRAALKFAHRAGSDSNGTGLDFALLASGADKVHLTGVLR